MTKASVLVLAGHGINGELEMARSFEQNGLRTQIVHVEDLISNKQLLQQHQIFAFPGGFSYGDDLGAGVALANRLRNNLEQEIAQFVSADKLVFGICNGFQMMVNLGILPGFDGHQGERKIALRHNATNRYQCRWVDLEVKSQKCIWTQGLDKIRVSVGHGEGNFFTDTATLQQLEQNDQIAFQYLNQAGQIAQGEFPANPNGAMNDIAGICDHSGRIMGMMPHPDRLLTSYHLDNWPLLAELARRNGQEFQEIPVAQQIYANAAKYFA